MKRLDDVLTRQKSGLLLDILLAFVLILAICIGALGVAKTFAATTGWQNSEQRVTSTDDAGSFDATLAHASNVAESTIRE